MNLEHILYFFLGVFASGLISGLVFSIHHRLLVKSILDSNKKIKM